MSKVEREGPKTRRRNRLSLAQVVTILLAALSIRQLCFDVLPTWMSWTLAVILFSALWVVGNRLK